MNYNEEKFWVYDVTSLVKPINLIPYGDIYSGSRLNAMTRLVLIIYMIMLACNYKFSHIFLIISLSFILAIHFCYKGSFQNIITTKENFETLSYHNNKMKNSLQSPNKTSYIQSKMASNAPLINTNFSNSNVPIQSEIPTKQIGGYTRPNYNDYGLAPPSKKTPSNMSYNNKNYNKESGYATDPENLRQNTLNPKVMLPNTRRDKEAGIQYYTVNQGINKNMWIEPLIVPRALDPEVWAFPSTYPSGMNANGIQEITEANNFPNGVNNYEMYNGGIRKFNRDERSIYGGVGYWESDVQPFTEDPMVTLKRKLEAEERKLMDEEKKKEDEKNIKKISTSYISPTEQLLKMNRTAYENNLISKSENPDYYDLDQTATLDNTYGGRNKVSSVDAIMSKGKPANYMIEPSPTYIYDDKYFEQPARKLFLQDIQPNIYSYAVEETPINSNIGITYTPQIPPKFRDAVYTDNDNYPIYTRVDPQLVRDDGTPGMRSQEPDRSPWSAKYSSWNPPAGSINFEDIYDSRFTSYGDPYRSYSDVNLGQVQYYYSDVDAYRRPNFIIRSNVDYINYKDPMNAEKPYYERTANLEDVKDIVQNRYDADDLYHREDLMSSQLAKRNSEMWQLKSAPLRQQNNSHYSTYGPY